MRKWSLIAIACIIALVLADRVSAHESIKVDGDNGVRPEEPAKSIYAQEQHWFSARDLRLWPRNGSMDYYVRLRITTCLDDDNRTLVAIYVRELPNRWWTIDELQAHLDNLASKIGVTKCVIEFGVPK